MVALGERASVVDKLMVACVYKDRFPQGGPCSPFLTNVGMHETDCCLAAYAKKHGFTYIRYADDMVFALNDGEPYDAQFPPKYRWFFRGVASIMEGRLGIKLNTRKNKTIRLNGRCKRQVLGIVLRKDGAGYNAPKAMRRLARAILCNLYRRVSRRGGVMLPSDHLDWLKVRGYVAYFDGLRYGGIGAAGLADPFIQEEFWNYMEEICPTKLIGTSK